MVAKKGPIQSPPCDRSRDTGQREKALDKKLLFTKQFQARLVSRRQQRLSDRDPFFRTTARTKTESPLTKAPKSARALHENCELDEGPDETRPGM